MLALVVPLRESGFDRKVRQVFWQLVILAALVSLCVAVLSGYVFVKLVLGLWACLRDKEHRDQKWMQLTGGNVPRNKFTLSVIAMIWLFMILLVGFTAFAAIRMMLYILANPT